MKILLILIISLPSILVFSQNQKEYRSHEIDELNKELIYQNYLIKISYQRMKKFSSPFHDKLNYNLLKTIENLEIKKSCFMSPVNDSVINFIHEKVFILTLEYLFYIQYSNFEKKDFEKKIKFVLTSLKEAIEKYNNNSSDLMILKKEILKALEILILFKWENLGDDNYELKMIYEKVYNDYVLKHPLPYIPE